MAASDSELSIHVANYIPKISCYFELDRKLGLWHESARIVKNLGFVSRVRAFLYIKAVLQRGEMERITKLCIMKSRDVTTLSVKATSRESYEIITHV